ncbi:MAG: uracil-DNA glycosylase [Sphingomonadales bacterium]|nr:uracil-DNA glycosylase [Sphingomonadales bacterium]NCO48757.1 uracil-DNA glycosylase [Sphingomonadales bacterium]NCO99908.1 uracil-DNA glycosylase [Sphingomonadales bacterium]NCP27396.1 uracil-DNA glycosylase [Sphingomonadales bacterium]NCP43152.1 uracil-DNA glycosylase [Sphingomonadales bacterium]
MSDHSPLLFAEAPKGCRRCSRLVGLRKSLRKDHPDWWNAPVPAFGDPDARLAIVGLAPGKEGANRTGRPFTGDASGEMLFATLGKFGFIDGEFANDPADGITLNGAIILNAVKCLPPENKPTAAEINNCRPYLAQALDGMPHLQIILGLGKIAHDSIIRLSGGRLADHKFAHGARHNLPGGRTLIDSYHCSRYNVNTGRLTLAMFEEVFHKLMAD